MNRRKNRRTSWNPDFIFIGIPLSPSEKPETEGGRLRLEIGYTNREYTISWLLGFGNKAKVIEPIDMADEIKSIAENIIQNYK